jgi:hypothetical protein
MKFFNIITNNFWLKVISLVLAVATWFYVFDLVRPLMLQKQETPEDVFERYQFTIKEVPVKIVFTGKVSEGYRVVYDRVNVIPSSIAIYGPEEIIEDISELRTEEVDLSKHNKTINTELGIVSDLKMVQFKDKIADVYIPIEKIEGSK